MLVFAEIVANIAFLVLGSVLFAYLIQSRAEAASEHVANLLYDSGQRQERLKAIRYQWAACKTTETITVVLPSSKKFDRFNPDSYFAAHLKSNKGTYKKLFSVMDELKNAAEAFDPKEDTADFLLAKKVDRWMSQRRYAALRKSLDLELAIFGSDAAGNQPLPFEFQQTLVWQNTSGSKKKTRVYDRQNIEEFLGGPS